MENNLKTQKDIVIDYFLKNNNKPTHYKVVSEETNIKVDSMRRILGVGVHENTFIRTETGVYIYNSKSELINSVFFEKGKNYKRSKIHDEFGGNRQKGISNSTTHPLIFLFTNPNSDQQKVYIDKWENGYFYYSGEGRKGDMKMTSGNQSILYHQKNQKNIHLFEKTDDSGFWKYIDQLELVDFIEYKNKDEDGNLRNGFQFILLSTTKKSKIDQQQKDLDESLDYHLNLPNQTERQVTSTQRVGQHLYRKMLLKKWKNKCGVSGSGVVSILKSSHIVPYRDSKREEKYDPENGILLSPNMDSLFDQNLISFKDNGDIIISNKLSSSDLQSLGVNSQMKLSHVSNGMKPYLSRHRKNIK